MAGWMRWWVSSRVDEVLAREQLGGCGMEMIGGRNRKTPITTKKKMISSEQQKTKDNLAALLGAADSSAFSGLSASAWSVQVACSQRDLKRGQQVFRKSVMSTCWRWCCCCFLLLFLFCCCFVVVFLVVCCCCCCCFCCFLLWSLLLFMLFLLMLLFYVYRAIWRYSSLFLKKKF